MTHRSHSNTIYSSVPPSISTSGQSKAATPSTPSNINDLLDAPIPSDERVPDVDDEIKKRLEVLKQPETNNLDESPLDDDAISKRLANLKDMPHKKYDDKSWLTAMDKRTEQERANDLMAQYMNEASIDNAVQDTADDAIKDIERRLNALKGGPNTSTTTTSASNDDSNEHVDDDTLAKKIATKVCQSSWPVYSGRYWRHSLMKIYVFVYISVFGRGNTTRCRSKS